MPRYNSCCAATGRILYLARPAPNRNVERSNSTQEFHKLRMLPKIGNFIRNIIMGRNTSVSLGDHFEDFVESSIANGRFKNASEVIRAGLRLLEEEEVKSATLRSAIKQGISSGLAVNFDPKAHLAALIAGRRKRG